MGISQEEAKALAEKGTIFGYPLFTHLALH